ncbi:unnamed protein product [Cutaneotrichosporon oleaginosum]
MLAQSLLLTIFAASAVASPTPELHDLLPTRFTPVERAVNALGNALQGRQAGGCPSGYRECGVDGCYPLDGSTCCGSEGTYCEPGYRCTSGGCCPVGEICTGQAGTRTISATGAVTSTRTSFGSGTTASAGTGSSGTGSSGTGSSGTGSSGTGSSGTGSSGTGSSGTGSSGTGSSGTGSSGTGSSGTGTGAAGPGGASAALPATAVNAFGVVLAVVLAVSA